MPIPVICVGNIVIGGSGKTPVTQALQVLLRELGHKPHVVSRGYGGKLKGPVLVSEKYNSEQVGDEPLLLSMVAPTWVSKDRMTGSRAAIENGCDVIITTDHGTVRVDEPSKVVGDRNTNTNLRYKQGKNLSYEKRDVFEIKRPDEAFLPKLNVAFFISIEGDKLGSSDVILIFNESDFCLGIDVNLSSLTVDATNLGESKNVNAFNAVGSNP